MGKAPEPNGVEPNFSEDDLQREQLGPRGVPGAPDPAKMTPQREKKTQNTSIRVTLPDAVDAPFTSAVEGRFIARNDRYARCIAIDLFRSLTLSHVSFQPLAGC
jgi:hypothetical protein